MNIPELVAWAYEKAAGPPRSLLIQQLRRCEICNDLLLLIAEFAVEPCPLRFEAYDLIISAAIEKNNAVKSFGTS